MIAVLFEAWPAEGLADRYFDLAAALLPDLDAIDGFLGIERFESLSEPGKLLSLSWWSDEAAIAAWRGFGRHRAAQDEGRAGIFRDYRISVATVTRAYGMRVPPDQL
jgi:heme-degrading monooxygenase HmoA